MPTSSRSPTRWRRSTASSARRWLSLLAQAESRPFILQAIAKPAERTLRWDEYRGKFLVERRIERGSEVYSQRQAELERAQAATGVPVDVILGIVGVETFFGENIGKHRVLDALATLAFDYPPRQKFFRAELEQYLVMAREEGLDPPCPSARTPAPWACRSSCRAVSAPMRVDGDADGRRDLWNDWADVFPSVGQLPQGARLARGRADCRARRTRAARTSTASIRRLALSETVGSLRQRGLDSTRRCPTRRPRCWCRSPSPTAPSTASGSPISTRSRATTAATMYASAVSDLADAIGARRSGQPMPAATTPVAPGAGTPAPAPISTGGWSTTTGSR